MVFCNFQKEQEQLQTKLTATEAMSENLLSDNTKLQVYITTLQSQSTSLASQHTALQLANSQLVAEKEEVSVKAMIPPPPSSLPRPVNRHSHRSSLIYIII